MGEELAQGSGFKVEGISIAIAVFLSLLRWGRRGGSSLVRRRDERGAERRDERKGR